ncbi:hypothetical protein ACIO3O_42035 [Streptomyces sp. NPDC087440]|uniref:hypothetical protein n=1 Tax=Streptomyces sp. NPDC087440 TaxID=3365790 RepID=UPI0037FE7007
MEDETWTYELYGKSHEGRVSVLLEDGETPKPVYVTSMSGGDARRVTHWAVYDGAKFHGPKAAALRATCSCGWEGETHTLDWEGFGDKPFYEAGSSIADKCELEWDQHTSQVGTTTAPLPTAITERLEELEREVEKLVRESPVAGLKAVHVLQVRAAALGHNAARAAASQPVEDVAAGLGMNGKETKALMARLGGWSLYR